LSGVFIFELLESAVEALKQGRSSSFPYIAGLRFDVNTKDSGRTLSNACTLNRSNQWVSLEIIQTYVVLTTVGVASGEDQDYSAFKQGGSINPTFPVSAIGTFSTYPREWKVLYNPPEAKCSTQNYNS
jgi:hypothetical protein